MLPPGSLYNSESLVVLGLRTSDYALQVSAKTQEMSLNCLLSSVADVYRQIENLYFSL